MAPIWPPATMMPYCAFAALRSTIELVHCQNSETAKEPYDSIAK